MRAAAATMNQYHLLVIIAQSVERVSRTQCMFLMFSSKYLFLFHGVTRG
jgi:hypothetical protein